MPKMKSHSGAKKRFKLTATGKVKHKQANKSHLLTHESHKRKRHLRGTKVVDHAQERQGERTVPYGGRVEVLNGCAGRFAQVHGPPPMEPEQTHAGLPRPAEASRRTAAP